LKVIPDLEAKVLATDIFELLRGHGWIVTYLRETDPLHGPLTPAGVDIYVEQPTTRPSLVNVGNAAGRALYEYLEAVGVDANLSVGLKPQPGWADNTIMVEVGMKPVAMMLGHSSITLEPLDPTNPIK
jgi:hypothetical protein